MTDFSQHFAGDKTLGHYMLGEGDVCKLFAFDIDLTKHDRSCVTPGCKACPVEFEDLTLSETNNPTPTGRLHHCIPRESFRSDHPAYETLVINLRCLADGLAQLIYKEYQIPVAIAYSGNKGLHVYGFTGEVPAEAAKTIATDLLSGTAFEAFKGDNFWRHTYAYPMLDVEVFPKQVSLDGKDLGNLMSLPLGIHQVTKNKKFFITSNALLNRLVEMNPAKVLDGDLPWE